MADFGKHFWDIYFPFTKFSYAKKAIFAKRKDLYLLLFVKFLRKILHVAAENTLAQPSHEFV